MTTSRPDWRWLCAHPAHCLAFGFGAGLASKAPGTFGTLVAFPVYALMVALPPAWYWAAVGLAVLAGVWVCARASRALGVHDHSGIVWDEIAAFLIVLPFAPQTLLGFALAFGLFRLFDVWKPFPIRTLDARVPGGLGIMLDDLLAAVYAVVSLELLATWI